MSQSKSHKLKFLLDTIPPGFLVDGRFLRKHGFQSKSLGDYVSGGWLERVGWGVYRRPLPSSLRDNKPSDALVTHLGSDPLFAIPKAVALASMQQIMHYDFHVGGLSALQMLGHMHHLPLDDLKSSEMLHLYGNVPSWLSRVPIDAKPSVHTRVLFRNDSTLGIFNADRHALINSNELSVWHYSIRASMPERAILEAIDQLPHHTTFDAIAEVFESLTSLRPKLLLQLLQACGSVKVKRLFCVFADYHRHAWREHLDLSHIGLGSGPRALIKGAKLHPVYQVSVSERYFPAYRKNASLKAVEPKHPSTEFNATGLKDD